MKIKAEDVAAYLEAHQEFFEDYADLLANIYVPHPHGGRAIPISERQILTLRERNRQIENKLRELIQFGEENDAIGERVHRMALALLGARNLEGLLHSLYFNLREDFAVPHVMLRLWGVNGNPQALPEFGEVKEELRASAEALINPHCGAQFEGTDWFGEDATRLRSFALVALRSERAFGLLVLASADAQRFYPEMGTLYLKRLGELASAALLRHLT
ncbi:MAG TPA: DUF484 family protein [Burkholderiales bacterium]|nr:DUF484 family protein [Burkholderiales bacterium]